jgi:hypothetical protein
MNKKLQNLDENQNYIFDELIDFLTKSYLEKTECTWSIGRQHIKLLCNAIFLLLFFFSY